MPHETEYLEPLHAKVFPLKEIFTYIIPNSRNLQFWYNAENKAKAKVDHEVYNIKRQ